MLSADFTQLVFGTDKVCLADDISQPAGLRGQPLRLVGQVGTEFDNSFKSAAREWRQVFLLGQRGNELACSPDALFIAVNGGLQLSQQVELVEALAAQDRKSVV